MVSVVKTAPAEGVIGFYRVIFWYFWAEVFGVDGARDWSGVS